MPEVVSDNSPVPVRLYELKSKLAELAQKSAVSQADIIRQAVDEFLARNDTPEKLIEATIRYRQSKIG